MTPEEKLYRAFPTEGHMTTKEALKIARVNMFGRAVGGLAGIWTALGWMERGKSIRSCQTYRRLIEPEDFAVKWPAEQQRRIEVQKQKDRDRANKVRLGGIAISDDDTIDDWKPVKVAKPLMNAKQFEAVCQRGTLAGLVQAQMERQR